MSEKVKVSREVADAIEILRKNNVTNFNIALAFTGEMTFRNPENIDAVDVLGYEFKKVDELYKFLLSEYEIEESLEEKFKKNYDKHIMSVNECENRDLQDYEVVQESYSRGYVNGANEYAKAHGFEIS